MVAHDSIYFASISRDFKKISEVVGDTSLSNMLTSTQNKFLDLDEKFRWVNKGNGTVGKWANTGIIKEEIAKLDTAFSKLKWHLQDRPKDFVGFSIFGLKAEGYQPTKDQKPYLDQTLDSLHSGKKIDYK